MKITKLEKTGDYHLIEIEYTFLWFKWTKKFIKIKENIFGFKSPNNYYTLGNMGFVFYDLIDVFESAEVMFKNKI
jgi:hypothetical protein